MRKFLLLVFIFFISISYSQNDKLNILAIGAHPDDCDSKFGGTAALFAEMGHNVKFLSLTSGDAGHQSEGGGALAKKRREESFRAGKALGIAEYETLDNHDGELMPDLNVRHQVIRAIRNWNADIVLGLRPNDYHPDHRNAGKVVVDASYMVIVPNVCPDTPPLSKNPLFLYMEDRFKKPYEHDPHIVISIDKTIEKKIDGLDAHTSQVYEWLPWTRGGDVSVSKIPVLPKERRIWLSKRVKKRSSSKNNKKMESLIKWYGEKRANKIKFIESFEIAEYGFQPSDEQLLDYFPMLKAN